MTELILIGAILGFLLAAVSSVKLYQISRAHREQRLLLDRIGKGLDRTLSGLEDFREDYVDLTEQNGKLWALHGQEKKLDL